MGEIQIWYLKGVKYTRLGDGERKGRSISQSRTVIVMSDHTGTWSKAGRTDSFIPVTASVTGCRWEVRVPCHRQSISVRSDMWSGKGRC
jgi:hypothetical protein